MRGAAAKSFAAGQPDAEALPSPHSLSRGALGFCFHCGAEIPDGMLIEESTDAETLSFCCHGCRGAYLLISGAGLADFYRRREWSEPGVAPQAYQGAYQDPYLSRFVYPSRAGSAIDIIIDGIRCASCVWLNEKILGRLDGVREARVNYATGRARVVFDPEAITPAAIFSRIGQIGYAPRPYTSSAAREGARREQRDLLFRFGTAIFLTMQLMAYSFALYAGYFQGIEPQMKNYLQLFSLLVTTPVVFYCGWPFLAGAWRGLVNRAPNMELLIAIGALSSYGYSLYATLNGGEVYFETAAMIVTLILAGRLLENSAKRRAAGGVERLLGLCAGQARRIAGPRSSEEGRLTSDDGGRRTDDGPQASDQGWRTSDPGRWTSDGGGRTPDHRGEATEVAGQSALELESLETVDPGELRIGDLILVAPGERFPVDGRIVEGTTDVDESAATGEALPVLKRTGDGVIAGSSNLTGAVRVSCEREAADSFIARVARLVEEAQSRRAPVQGVADRVSAFFVPAVLFLALATFCWHYLAQAPLGASLMSALAVVVIACPCALGLATPTAILAGTGAAALGGVIFKGGDILERLSRVKLAVFDKTGTLTCGSPELVEIRPASGVDRRDILSLAASVESGSLHPIARAIREHATANGIFCAVAGALQSVAGGGVTGRVAGEQVALGSERFLERLGVSGVPGALEAAGSMVVCVARGGEYLGAMILRDRMRQDAPALVSYFSRAGIRTLLLSGDGQESAGQAAALAGIGAGIGGLSPADKAARIEALRRAGATVLMVGDGINDAPALSAADVGCAVAGGTDIAIETSDLVLVKPDLERLALAHRMARRTMSVVRQNLVWAFVYNLVGIPLAMTGRLTPIYAAAAMALSSLCVVGNSLRLLRGKR